MHTVELDRQAGLVMNLATLQRFHEAIDFAHERGLLRNLMECMQQLSSGDDQWRVELCYDHEPYSFGFRCYRWQHETLEHIYSGGLIYHGPLPDGHVGGTSSIQLVPCTGWQIHT